ncbi:MAG: cyclic nucleotide-binding domain-containing protein, partial [Candidatus Sericytochromatia bacterium]
RVPMFQDVSGDFLRELVNRVRTQIFNRGDYIVRKGESGEEMFLIRQGQVEVLDSKNLHVVARMNAGDIFGEVALMLGLPRNASVRAGGYCELFVVKQKDLDALLPDYPEVKERLLMLARDRQQQEQLRSEADQEQLRTRIQVLMAQKGQPLLGTRAASARTQSETPGEVTLAPLEFWAVHPQSGQLARVNRTGEAQILLGPLQGLVQPVAALETPNGTWVLDMGLNSLQLLEGDRTRTSLERWGSVFLAQPRALADTPDGSLWIANTGRGELLHLSSSGELLKQLSLGRAPASVAVLADGNLLVTDVRQHTVSEVSPDGEERWRYGTPRSFGRDENLLFAPEFAQRLANGNTLIADTGNSRILEVDPELRIVWSVTSAAGLRVIRPTRAQRLDSGNTLIEHSNHFYWLEITPEQIPAWRYTLPVRGFFFAEAGAEA